MGAKSRKQLVLTLCGGGILLTGLVLLACFIYPSQSPFSLIASPTGVPTVTPEHLATGLPGFHYIEVIDGCGPYYQGTCVNMRAGPGTEYPSVGRLRNGVVLKVASTTTQDATGKSWYTVVFSTPLLYPERVEGNWYVAVDPASILALTNTGDEDLTKETPETTKYIVVDVSEEMLYAYDGDVLFMKEPISTGLEFTPTPRGTFTIFRKTPSRYMQGPIPGVSDQVYDLPGVPWNLYFTTDGAVIHGAYWHDHFGAPWSHGCVNLSPENAKKLYQWAVLGMKVTVRN